MITSPEHAGYDPENPRHRHGIRQGGTSLHERAGVRMPAYARERRRSCGSHQAISGPIRHRWRPQVRGSPLRSLARWWRHRTIRRRVRRPRLETSDGGGSSVHQHPRRAGPVGGRTRHAARRGSGQRTRAGGGRHGGQRLETRHRRRTAGKAAGYRGMW